MKYTITATIPTGQYANLQPSIEVEAGSMEEAEKLVMPHIEDLSAKYGEEGKALRAKGSEGGAKVKLVSPLDGGYAYFDEAAHVYTNSKGEQYKNASKFVKQFEWEFPKDMILDKMAKAYKVDANHIADMWRLKSDSSLAFGNSLHYSLEMWGKYQSLGESISKGELNKAMHDQPTIQKAVETFFAGRGGESALYEAFVVDMDNMRCGLIDRLLIVDKEKKICRVQDYKTNANIEEVKGKGKQKVLKAPFDYLPNSPLGKYKIQLSYYANLLMKLGWTVEGCDIFNYTDKWKTFSFEPINLNKNE